jgi:integrase
LTEEMVRLLKPPQQGRVVYYDQAPSGVPGLLFTINAGGSKTWSVQRYSKVTAKAGKLAGQTITMPTSEKLGRYPILSLKDARERAKVKLAKEVVDRSTFADVMGSYLEQEVRGRLRTARHIEWSLRHYIPADWAHKRFADIRRSDVKALTDAMKSARQADLVRSYLRSMMKFYTEGNDEYVSPLLSGSKSRYSIAEHRRSRILDHDELRALWKVAPELGPFGAMCQLLLLTAQRRGKVLTMRHDDIINDSWIIRSEKREKGNPGVLPLPKMALAIIRAQPVIRGRPEVFMVGGLDAHKQELDRKMAAVLGRPVENWVLHDLRRSSRSLMSWIEVRPDVAERVLGHGVGSAVAQTYDRYPYAREMGEALKALAAEVARIVAVPQQPARAARKAAGKPSRRRLGG